MKGLRAFNNLNLHSSKAIVRKLISNDPGNSIKLIELIISSVKGRTVLRQLLCPRLSN